MTTKKQANNANIPQSRRTSDELKDLISVPSLAYERMTEKWDLLDDLDEGIEAMRAAGTKWLPPEYLEKDHQYMVRLNRSFLYPGFRDALDKAVAKPFSRETVLVKADELNDKLKKIEKDVDKTGKSLTTFAREVMREGIKRGLTHVFIDYPSLSPEATRADEETADARPVFLHISPKDFLGWNFEYSEGGKISLTSIRFLEVRTEEYGEYGEQEVTYLRRVTTDEWELWRADPEKDISDPDAWDMIDSGRHTFGGVPLVTYYVNRQGFMVACSPFDMLAQLNLAHWQSYSDFRNGVRHTTHGLLFFKGLTEEEMSKTAVLGPAAMFRTTGEEADGKYIEHEGKGLGFARTALKDLEEQMEALGMRPMVSRSGDATATGRVIDESRSFTDIQTWIQTLELTLKDCYRMAAKWVKTEVSDEFQVNVNNDFGVSLKDAKDKETLENARARGDLTHETYLGELKRRGVLDEVIDIKKEAENAKAEYEERVNAGLGDDFEERTGDLGDNKTGGKFEGDNASDSITKTTQNE